MADEATATEKHILYFADPMCSWCWGFAPVIDALAAAAADRATLRVIMGGLRPGTTRPMSARAKTDVRHHWEEVQALTGQPFAFDFFAREGFVYDTEPASRAVVVVQNRVRARALAYLHAIQHAFYAENRDVTDATILASLAEPFAVDAPTFATDFASYGAIKTTQAGFQLAQTMGIGGFPTVILRDAGGFACLTAGYQPLAELRPLLAMWLDG